MASEFKTALTRYLNARARARDEFREEFVALLSPETAPAERIVERETEFLDELTDELTARAFEVYLPQQLAAARRMTETIAKLADMEFPADTPGVSQARLDIATRAIELAVDSSAAKFELDMAKLSTATKPIELLTADLEASRPSIYEKRTTGRKGRAVDALRFGSGKFYSPAFKAIFTAIETEVESITSAAAARWQGTING